MAVAKRRGDLETDHALVLSGTGAAARTQSGADIQRALKRSVDVAGASLLILAASPLLIGIAAAIRLSSPGPILFKQQRYGLNAELFEIYKFRTMSVDEEDRSGVAQTRKNDPRVTSVGKALRRLNLDELPQLFNVLRGDMSLVGPRPHVPGMRAGGLLYEHLVPNYHLRHRMRPGMTGLAQINRLRGSTSDAKFAKARIEYDIAYTSNWSLVLDLRILWLTFKTEVLRGSGI
jgi:lipopolysaccharide/colanic/teichoic acid biosynthesis glycosyltransferase